MSRKRFQGNGLPFLIGSLPVRDHAEAAGLVWEYTPEIPLWAQLPARPGEGMMDQFTTGLPGWVEKDGNSFVDTEAPGFADDMLRFYEGFLAVQADRGGPGTSRFELQADTAQGFFTLIERIGRAPHPPAALKGQVTGPFTLTTGLHDGRGRAIIYDDQLRDAAVKLIALKARWQAQRLAAFGRPVIISVDEPALAGFGSSEFISISRDDVAASLAEVIDAIHDGGGLAAIHVCANTDWALVLGSSADIVSFDAYAYFDRFILYRAELQRFLDSGRLLAWGIVPTLSPEDLARATAGRLVELLKSHAAQVMALGFTWEQVRAQSLVTPACGMGSLTLDLALRALKLTRDVSLKIRNE
jgi:methionine synthase II (cobalamin-independent)